MASEEDSRAVDQLALVALGVCIGVLLTIALLAIFADGSILAATEGISLG